MERPEHPAGRAQGERDKHPDDRPRLARPEPPTPGGAEEPAGFPGGAAVACRELTIRYPGRPAPALRGVTLSIPAGQRVLLLGPSGSGKSTLAFALAGIIPRIVEAEVQGELRPARQAGVLFQDPEAQFCMFTVDEEVAFGLENRCVPAAEMPPRVAAALAAAGLPVPFGHPIHALSGGQKQRLALASVLTLEPALLVLDEPTAQLDPPGRALVLEALRRLDRRHTVLVVEHNLDGVVDWVDRVVLLAPGGRVLADGEPKAVFSRYRAEIETYGIWRPRSWGPFWSPVLARHGGSSEAHLAGTPPAPGPEPLPASHGQLAGEALVRLDGVAAAHGARPVWSGVSLAIGAGEWVAVVGANGAGKSTFLQVVAGLHAPAAGRVVYGPALEARRGAPPRVGFVFQNPEHQFVTDTVYDEVALAGRLAGIPEPVLRPRVEELLRRFGLEGFEGVHPYTLSQGQKRRLSVASMLVVPQPLLVLDEPTFGQDARTAAALVEELVRLHRQGTTLVMATHDLELAAAAATRLLVFGQGRLLYDGPPADFLDDPARVAAAGLAPAPADPAAVEAGPRPAPDTAPATAAPDLPSEPPHRRRVPWIGRVHPAWKLAAHLVMAAVVLATADPAALAALLAVPVVLGLTVGGVGPRRWLVAMAPFLLVAATRVWTLGAFGEGERVVGQILWYRFTAEGLHQGLVVGLRLLNLGALGVLYAGTTGLTDLVLGLMQQWRLSPQWAYGILAALRFVPLFEEDLGRVRKAYRVRGLGGQGLGGRLQVIYRYSLAMLVQAIRAAETVAVALQARGFDGRRPRTFYRTLPAGRREVGYAALLLAMAALALIAARRLA
ncbi:ATP-binding cassette domain-containing protein [Thermaerobacter marianensis]|uniref:ATP-binding cassette domain-containing protein n=1 Tax=Thermaerobacter marianensis TaxID=73919 RepID=UPI0002DB2349|nr:ATP-binding cassette domain-containing protein [Thermaerobacter marianensis]